MIKIKPGQDASCLNNEDKSIVKPSQYNFYVNRRDSFGDEALIFNARSASLIQVDIDTYTKVKEALISEMDSSIIKELKTGKFLIDAENDEIAEINDYFKSIQKHKEKKLSITIAPTLNCNLACEYCFQKDYREPGIMSENTSKQIAKFVKENLPNNSILHVNWFGGEPLLYPNIIENLSNELIGIAKEKQSKYLASIVTNGTLLDAAVERMLVTAQVNSCQITIDGLKEIHDKRRPSRSGDSSFLATLENISSMRSSISIV